MTEPKLSVETTLSDSRGVTYVKHLITRERPTRFISDNAAAVFDQMLRDMFAQASQSPEVLRFQKFFKGTDSIDRDMALIEMDRQAVAAEREQAFAAMTGERLSDKLLELDARIKSLTDRMASCHTGKNLFAQELKAAKTAALTAVRAQIANSLMAASVEIKTRKQEAVEAIQSEAFPALLDAMAVSECVSELYRSFFQQYRIDWNWTEVRKGSDPRSLAGRIAAVLFSADASTPAK